MRRWKKTILAATMLAGIMGTSLIAYAYDVPFDITIPTDTISPRSQKDDAEQCFYVWGTYFNDPVAVLSCFSIGITDSSVFSYEAQIWQAYPSSRAYYQTYAQAGDWFYMMTYSTTGNNFNVWGRYTP